MNKLLIAVIIFCFLVVLFGLFGKWGFVVLFGLLVTAPFIAFAVLKHMKGSHTTSRSSSAPLQSRGFGFSWIVVLIGIGLLMWANASLNKQSRAEVATNSEIGAVQPKYEWTWKLPRGQTIHGRNENASNEKTAEVIPRNDGSLWFDIHYVEYGSPETERVRLGKVGEKSWSGDRDQDNPKDHSRVNLREIAPGVYAGVITWPNKMIATCSLVRK